MPAKIHAQNYIPWGVLQADCVETRQFWENIH